MDRTPVTILTGFLGSGKTTLLNRILREHHGMRIAVIENEFGEIGVDNDLVVGADEEIVEMNNGCICCTVRGDLVRILGNLLRRRERFDRIVVETTGMADPAPVAQTFLVDEEIRRLTVLDAIVTVVDAFHLRDQLAHADEPARQLAFADTILLNKCDLVDETGLVGLEALVRAANPMADLVRSVRGEVPLDRLLDRRAFDLQAALARDPAFLEPEHPFEWGCVFRVPADGARLVCHEGPDPSLKIALGTLPEPDLDDAARRAESIFADRFASKPAKPPLAPATHTWELDLQRVPARGKVFGLALTPGSLALLFTQHHPDEFRLRLESPSRGGIEPLLERAWKGTHEHSAAVMSVGLEAEGDLDLDRVEDWIGGLLTDKGADLFRYKGILAIAGRPARLVLQGVHMLVDHVDGAAWGREPPRSRMVFIGRDLDRKALSDGFRACRK